MSDRYKQINLIVDYLKPASIVEIGTWNGDRAIDIAQAALKHHTYVHYWGFDVFEQVADNHDQRELNVKPHTPLKDVRAKLKIFREQHPGFSFDLIKGVVDPMIENKFGRIVNITSGSVKSPIPQLGLSNGARAALTGFCAGLSRQVARHNVTVNGLLPGQFNTDRIEMLIANMAKTEGRTPAEVRSTLEERNPTGRLGEIEEFGFACAWMCSARSSYLTGQNILIDGGMFNSTL